MEARFSASVQTGPGAHPASYTMGIGSSPGVKRPGRSVDHPRPSSTEVEGRVELYVFSPYGHSWPVLGRTLPLYWQLTVSVTLLLLFQRLRVGTIPDFSSLTADVLRCIIKKNGHFHFCLAYRALFFHSFTIFYRLVPVYSSSVLWVC